MNDELQKQIAAILKQALEAAQHGGQWLSGQIPDVLNQLLVWTMAMGVVGLLVVIFIAWVNVRLWRATLKSEQWDELCLPMILVSMVSAAVGFFFGGNAIDGLKAAIAPKLFLLEYAAHLLK